MNPVKTMTGVVTRPVHTAASVAGRAIGLSLGATKAGVRTTGRIVEWAADRGLSAPEATSAPQATSAPRATRAPGAAVPSDVVGATNVSEPAPTPSGSQVPTPADVKPAIDRSAPLEAEAPEAEEDLRTASGIPAAGVGVNPATGEPNAYDTEPEPLLDPATVKAVRSETDVLRRAAGDEPARKPARKTAKNTFQEG